MSFGYNEVDIEDIESVQLASGDISPNACEIDGSSGNLTSEQKRKVQMVDFLEDDFNRFHSLLDDLIACYHSFGRRNEFLSETLDIPDYVKCRNCSRLRETADGTLICLETEEQKDGDTLYKTIRDPESVPSYCSPGMRWLGFPEDRLDEVNNELLSIAEAGYEQYANDQRERYEERREEALEDGRQSSKYVTEGGGNPFE